MSIRALKSLVASMAAVGIAAVAAPAFAGSASANVVVTATVIPSCLIVATPVAFGVYDPVFANASGNVDSFGTLTITCTKGSDQTIALDNGSNASGSTRRMGDGLGNHLTYELYQDSSRSQVWGSGSSAYTPPTATSALPRIFTVYGRMAGGQDATLGLYTDIVVATVNF